MAPATLPATSAPITARPSGKETLSAMQHQFHPTVLREYDIRGVIGETLGADDARAIGRAFGTLLREAGGATVAVGYDGRVSSPMLEHALVEGVTSSGCDVVRIGLSATPMLYTRKPQMNRWMAAFR